LVVAAAALSIDWVLLKMKMLSLNEYGPEATVE